MDIRTKQKLSVKRIPEENVVILECVKRFNGIEYKEVCAFLLQFELADLKHKRVDAIPAMVISGSDIGRKVDVMFQDANRIYTVVYTDFYGGDINEVSHQQFIEKQGSPQTKFLTMGFVWSAVDTENAKRLKDAQDKWEAEQKRNTKKESLKKLFDEIEEIIKSE